MLRVLFLVTIVGSITMAAAAQTDLQKLVDTEKAFAKMAVDKNTRDAFLAYMADTSLVFTPDRTDAKVHWTARTANNALLSWAPNFADISSNGVMGYTTGNWEFREKRDAGTVPSGFGDFITVWLRQNGGAYKWVVDIGTTHDRPVAYSTDWTTAPVATGKPKPPTGEFATAFYQLAMSGGVVKAYDAFADENIRSYREGKMPILGKKNAISELKGDKAEMTFSKRSTALAAGDLGYILNTYAKSKVGKQIEKGNYLQIWKFSGGKWHIVLDIFKPVPAS